MLPKIDIAGQKAERGSPTGVKQNPDDDMVQQILRCFSQYKFTQQFQRILRHFQWSLPSSSEEKTISSQAM